MNWFRALFRIQRPSDRGGTPRHMDRLREVSEALSRDAAVADTRVQDVIHRTATNDKLARIDAEFARKISADRRQKLDAFDAALRGRDNP